MICEGVICISLCFHLYFTYSHSSPSDIVKSAKEICWFMWGAASLVKVGDHLTNVQASGSCSESLREFNCEACIKDVR